MTTPGLLMAALWGLVWQLPWIAGLIIAGLLYWRWKTSGVRFIVLALGLLIVWAVAGPLVMLEARGALWDPGVGPLTAAAISFLGNVISIVLVLFLAIAFFWLMKDLAERAER